MRWHAAAVSFGLRAIYRKRGGESVYFIASSSVQYAGTVCTSKVQNADPRRKRRPIDFIRRACSISTRGAMGITHSARPKQLASAVLYAEAIYTSTRSTRWISAPIVRWPLRICAGHPRFRLGLAGASTPSQGQRPLNSEPARRH